jgi:tetratricopeptide (TPR) repeat protein
VADIVTRCDRLPLALALVAARAATRPGFSLAAVAGGLPAPGEPLGGWADGDSAAALRAAFDLSYQRLGSTARRLFRLLPAMVGADGAVPAVASLAACRPARARALLAELAAAHLVGEPVPARFGSSALHRAYAVELTADPEGDPPAGDPAAGDPPDAADRRAARGRVLDHYLHAADAAALALDPHRDPLPLADPAPGVVDVEFADGPAALAWFGAEEAVLRAAVREATAGGRHGPAWQLAWFLGAYLRRRGHWADLAAVHEVGLAAARRAADPVGQAYALRGLAAAAGAQGRPEEATGLLRQALDLAADDLARARAHQELAAALAVAALPRQGLDHAGRALRLHRAAGNRAGAAATLGVTGWLHALSGDHTRSVPLCAQALAELRGLADDPDTARAYYHLAESHRLANHRDRAAAAYRQCADLAESLADAPLLAAATRALRPAVPRPRTGTLRVATRN